MSSGAIAAGLAGEGLAGFGGYRGGVVWADGVRSAYRLTVINTFGL